MRIRLTTAVCLAAGLLLLTSCRTDPKVAAYVGDTTITEEQVSALVDDFSEKAEAVAQTTGQTAPQVTRNDAVQLLVAEALCDRLSKQKSFSYNATITADNTTQMGQLNERVKACVSAIPQDAVDVNEADVRELYDHLISTGAIPETATFDQAAPQLASAAALNKALLSAAPLTLNPRYSSVNFVGLPLVPGSVVIDRPVQQQETPVQQ